ncbi:class I SAM-dependent methyltransferase [Luminiphilus sp.]|nr:class I SAM-dependent methyltransferase [Luminiphilus sp.]
MLSENQPKIKSFLEGGHSQIEGWFFPLDHFAFFECFKAQSRLNVTGSVAEVGVWKGKSFTLLSLLRKDREKLIGFDLFAPGHLDETKQNIKSMGYDSLVNYAQGLTSDLNADNLLELIDQPIRFLHIDAGHEYHEVLEQLEIFTPYLLDDAIIAMDDFQDREFPGVAAAVLDFSERDRPRRFIPFLAGANKMYMCAPHRATVFQKTLLTSPAFKDKCRLTRIKDYTVLILGSKLPVESAKLHNALSDLTFPLHKDTLSTNEAARRYAQITFGMGLDQ